MLAPADVCIGNVKHLLQVLRTGRWMLDVLLEAVKLALAFGIFWMLAAVYLDRTYPLWHIKNDFAWRLISIATFVALPIITRWTVSSCESKEESFKTRAIFTKNYSLGLIASIIIAAVAIFMTEKETLCSLAAAKGLALRGPTQQYECKNLLMLLAGGASMI